MARSSFVGVAAAPVLDTTLAHAVPPREHTRPIDLSHHLNRATRERLPSQLKALYKYFSIPGMLNLAGGLPFPGYFPFDTLEAVVASSSRFPPKLVEQLNAPVPVLTTSPPPRKSRFFSFLRSSPDPSTGVTPASHLLIPKHTSLGPPGSHIDVSTTLQYGQSTGFPPLVEFVKDFALNHLHGGKIPYENPEILLTCGNTDGFGKVMEMIAERGDNMLVEEFAYPNAFQTAAPFGVGMAPVKIDREGILVEAVGGLRDVLENWDFRRRGRRPRFMYTVTVGQNPTGGVLSLERRKAIYAMCERFDVIIVEDDPYWFLQYTESSHPRTPATTKKRYPFLDALTPSFLTIDTAGRVVRLDTFSKSIAPGCRLGWVTAQAPFIERLSRIAETTTHAPSGFSQALVTQLLQKIWGMDGWVTWLQGLRSAYEARMHAMCRVLTGYQETTITTTAAPDDDGDSLLVDKLTMYSFDAPMGGMFVWVHVHITSHPSYAEYLSRGHTKREMMSRLWGYGAEHHKCLSCPGWVFAPTPEIARDSSAERLRLCFAALDAKDIVLATERFGTSVREFWGFSVEEVETCCSDNGIEEEGVEYVSAGVPLFGC